MLTALLLLLLLPGHYWGSISAEGCNETVEGADVVITVGFVRTDYSTLVSTKACLPRARFGLTDFLQLPHPLNSLAGSI